MSANLVNVSDYVIDFLSRKKIANLFLVSGGGIMHLLDAAGRHSKLKYTCNFHEQACAIAAEGYARAKNQVGACLVTVGPGSTNALAGIVGAWVDSVPVIVISGQVRRDLIADYSKIRQLGPQEINIIEMAKPVTKYAVTVMDPLSIRRELEKAWHHATTGRPGPVWINIPLDVQGCEVDVNELQGYSPEFNSTGSPQPEELEKVISMLAVSKRPILVCGNGIQLAHAREALVRFAQRFGIPVVATFGGIDLLGETDALNLGRFGPYGQRRANFAVQTADLVIGLGVSFSVASIGFNLQGFAPKAEKIMVNIDPEEWKKPTLQIDCPVIADVALFIEALSEKLEKRPPVFSSRWLPACAQWKQKYPALEHSAKEDEQFVNSYDFVDALSDRLSKDDIILTGNSLDAVSVFQAFRVIEGQRVFTNINYGSMGWDLPAAVGAATAQNGKRTILITGDGSLQFNVQELLTISHNKLRLKIFVLNNDGYESIRTTQTNYFQGRLVGSSLESGVPNPNFELLASAYGIPYTRMTRNRDFETILNSFLESDGPGFCELRISPTQPRSPKVTSVRKSNGKMETRPLEDMFPFLPPEEVRQNVCQFDDEDNERE